MSTRCQVCLNPMMFLLLPWKKCPRWEQSCTERLLLENKSTKRTAKEAATRLWSCMLLLHLTPTCADALCNLILGTSTLVHVVVHPLQLALVVFFIQPLTQILYLHTWWYHPLQLLLVAIIFQQLLQIIHMHSSNLHCVVVVYSGIQYQNNSNISAS